MHALVCARPPATSSPPLLSTRPRVRVLRPPGYKPPRSWRTGAPPNTVALARPAASSSPRGARRPPNGRRGGGGGVVGSAPPEAPPPPMFQPARDPERPAFHLAPPNGGWLNDPNGPMVDKEGRIHLVRKQRGRAERGLESKRAASAPGGSPAPLRPAGRVLRARDRPASASGSAGGTRGGASARGRGHVRGPAGAFPYIARASFRPQNTTGRACARATPRGRAGLVPPTLPAWTGLVGHAN